MDLEPSPPDGMPKTSQWLSMENNRQDKETGNRPGDVESDSGDSLFITQKPVPNAGRSVRQRSTPISPSFLEGSGSSNDLEADRGLGRKKKRHVLPKYNFPFLKRGKRKSRDHGLLAKEYNTGIHYYALGGFFSCVRDIWPDCEGSECVEPSLPTVDTDTEEITPLTEEEKSDEEDIKIVDKREFVYSLTPQSSQPWYNPQKKDKGENQKSNKAKATFTTSKTAPQQKFKSRKSLTRSKSDENGRLQRKVAGQESARLQSKEHHTLDCSDSDATFIGENEPSSSKGISGEAEKDASKTLTELQPGTISIKDPSPVEELDDMPESQSFLGNARSCKSGSNNDRTCHKKRLEESKKKKKNKEAALALEDILFDHNSTKCPDPVQRREQEPDELLSDDNTEREEDRDPFGVHDMENDLENTLRTESVSLWNCNVETELNGQRLSENPEQLSFGIVLDPLHIGDSRIRKKKKKKRNKETCNRENAEKEMSFNVIPSQISNNVQLFNFDNIAVSEEVSNLSDGKRIKHKKKQKASSDNWIDEEAVSLKKDKKTLRFFDSEVKNHLSKSAEGSQEQAELVNNAIYAMDNTTTQNDESVSAQKKKKKRRASFFVAETVENSQLHLEQNIPSQSGEVHGCGADTLGISTNNNETESAETGGHLHEPVVKRRKKKHKRDRVDEDHGKEFEEPDNLGPDALPKVTSCTETTETCGIVKKCRRGEREECHNTEVSHPQSDESEQPKKKKKKSKRESHQTNVDSEVTTLPQTSEREEESTSLTSPNGSENPVTEEGKKKKKKRKHYDDATEVKAVETMELEQDTVKRKKHKKSRIKDHEPELLVELCPSSDGTLKKSKTKAKKKLYNSNEDFLTDF